MVYLGSRRFLSQEHRFRRSRGAFNNETEERTDPRRQSGVQVFEQGRARAAWLRKGGAEDSDADPVKRHSVKRASILVTLPYWKVSLLLEPDSFSSLYDCRIESNFHVC